MQLHQFTTALGAVNVTFARTDSLKTLHRMQPCVLCFERDVPACVPALYEGRQALDVPSGVVTMIARPNTRQVPVMPKKPRKTTRQVPIQPLRHRKARQTLMCQHEESSRTQHGANGGRRSAPTCGFSQARFSNRLRPGSNFEMRVN